MLFVDYLRNIDETVAGDIASVDSKLDTKIVKRKLPKSLVSEDSTTNTIIHLFKDNKMKIKLINPSPFGLQVDFFKKPNVDEVKELLKTIDLGDISVKSKGLSIFIEL